MSALLVAVDVGTTSARAGVMTATGALLARAQAPIAIRREGAERGEHDSDDIWRAVCKAVRDAVVEAGADPAEIKGIGFAATCSLVVPDGEGAAGWDTIAWFDHRAIAEAEEINATGHRVLEFSGGALSPEMEIPKLLWLKRNRPELWARAGMMFDLADFLSWKASGATVRSQSTLTGKWCFLAHEDEGWPCGFLDSIGLEDVLERAGLPQRATPVGAAAGTLTQGAAEELGLSTGVVVTTGMVDAHAGALGLLGGLAQGEADRHLGLIAGTSSAVVALAPEPRPMRGIWGPYHGAVLPGVWFSEGGQSASGAALDWLLAMHPDGKQTHDAMIARIEALRESEPDLAPRLNVLPDFHGNRSPLADPRALGVVSGMTLDGSLDGLARLYWRTMVGLALGVRHILETLNSKGFGIDTLHVAGGHARNRLLVELYADVTGCRVHRLSDGDAMLLGVAMAAASAAGIYRDLPQAARAMRNGSVVREPDKATRARYDRDYTVFLRMQAHWAELETMAGAGLERIGGGGA
ncbi:FGGY-family carbohydrate kinase [Pelagibacterium mangrovi]|uniref:FGGY-family carbohydrate kinase n=1 Tax=Pelagibacterium mangrovi TaxID=3119828 RepID=UPI002FC86AE6